MVRLPLSPEEIMRGKLLGETLRRARGGRPMLDVALAAGISPETLRKIESGRVPTPSFSTVAMLAMALELSLDTVWRTVHEGAGAAVSHG
ncbi:helix-turn-helix domain-containing protein [Arthrobacter wenxiniae]|jgi:transcriptional regulator with XRE-family HTH domain|uniref:Helix-turn-helix transcriptional regulator n=1 Tax=Arthrobacter wenxiniae TaxID=2713570 RepID=A0A7Y7IJ78_9MICC|nr:helix-turn-helix transcriptional regulator [Arthrobacter wenxiniae]NVM95851.1 helix-turn-helix transcriptional regulator [Arthrobacter wenxiniae]